MPNNPRKIGVLVAQLGTPKAPTAKAVRPYLRQFLSDPRVIDLHPLKWYPILYLFVLTLRPARSAALYANIWTDEGSPLMVHSKAQTKGLQERLGDDYRVILGMRYGEPSIEQAIKTLEAEGIDRILVQQQRSFIDSAGRSRDGLQKKFSGPFLTGRLPRAFASKRFAGNEPLATNRKTHVPSSGSVNNDGPSLVPGMEPGTDRQPEDRSA